MPGGIGLVLARLAALLRAVLLLAALLDEAVVALVAWSGFVDRVF